MASSDAELVKKALNNEIEAFKELVDRYKRKVYFTSLGIVGNAHDAEDVLQETLMQAFRSLRRLRHPAGFGAWILRMNFSYLELGIGWIKERSFMIPAMSVT